MNRYKHFALPAYLVALSLVGIPYFDAAMQVYPFNLGNAQWRFGAIGLVSNAFLIPAIGILLALAVAIALGHAKVLKTLGVVCAAWAIFMVLTFGLFGLDAFQTRLNVTPEASLSFAVASVTAGVKLLISVVTLAAFAIAGLKTRLDDRKPKAAPMVAPQAAAIPSASR